MPFELFAVAAPYVPHELAPWCVEELHWRAAHFRLGVAHEAAREELLKAGTILWAAGIKASRLNQDLESPLDGIGRVEVQGDLSLASYPEVFVAGDQASCTQEDGVNAPPLAPAAIQQGSHAARNILADLNGEPRAPFSYHDMS